jgi:hypothetical protein
MLLIIWGAYGYAKGKIDLRRQSYLTELPKGVFTIEEAEKKIKDSILNSTILLISASLGVFIVIYNSNKPGKKRIAHNYKF